MSEHVRPTLRALTDLGRSLPPLDSELHLIDDVLILKAQALPLAVLLDAVPGVSADDWQIEPSEVIGITPTAGQIIYSAMIPADSLSQVLDQVDDHFL